MAKFPFTIKVSDKNNRFDDEIVQNDIYGVGQILGQLHGKFYNHYGANYMRWISVEVADHNGHIDVVDQLTNYSAKCFAKYYSSKKP